MRSVCFLAIRVGVKKKKKRFIYECSWQFPRSQHLVSTIPRPTIYQGHKYHLDICNVIYAKQNIRRRACFEAKQTNRFSLNTFALINDNHIIRKSSHKGRKGRPFLLHVSSDGHYFMPNERNLGDFIEEDIDQAH